MLAGQSTAVKICCINDVAESRMAVSYGVAAVGLVAYMPTGPGIIDERMIARIAAQMPPNIGTFLLTSETDPAAIARQALAGGVNTVQICDRLAEGAHQQLRKLVRSVALVQVVHVLDDDSYHEALHVAPKFDALLLDSGNPYAAERILGGTGQTHDWDISRRIVRDVETPVFLAGGLNADNVAAAIREVRPYGVDVCTGVRTSRRLDRSKLVAFLEAVRIA